MKDRGVNVCLCECVCVCVSLALNRHAQMLMSLLQSVSPNWLLLFPHKLSPIMWLCDCEIPPITHTRLLPLITVSLTIVFETHTHTHARTHAHTHTHSFVSQLTTSTLTHCSLAQTALFLPTHPCIWINKQHYAEQQKWLPTFKSLYEYL